MTLRWFRSTTLPTLFVTMFGVAGAMSCSDDGGGADTGMSGAGTNGGGSAGDLNAAGTVNEAAPVGFESDIWPILTANCSGISCHGDGSFLPQHAHSDVDIAFAEAGPVADRIAGRVSATLTPIMPQFCGPAPGLGTCLSLEEVALIRAWVEQDAPF